MTYDIAKLYSPVIRDHANRPRNCGRLSSANLRASSKNPLCGDCITVYLRVEDGIVREASFESFGCALCRASASLLTEVVRGLDWQSVRELSKAVEQWQRKQTLTRVAFARRVAGPWRCAPLSGADSVRAAALADRVGGLRSEAILLKIGLAARGIFAHARLELPARPHAARVIKTSLAKWRVEGKLLGASVKSQMRHGRRVVAGAVGARGGLWRDLVRRGRGSVNGEREVMAYPTTTTRRLRARAVLQVRAVVRLMGRRFGRG
ncbi:MAG: iron-sulfur cluster assembly scaffold protein [Verrucomicrobia bacterium]|nr:iron-sulfur cluster assembly scaffold protein [Verrucomicrobiota bacterium]